MHSVGLDAVTSTLRVAGIGEVRKGGANDHNYVLRYFAALVKTSSLLAFYLSCLILCDFRPPIFALHPALRASPC
jgi:hypothetical protein